MNKTATKNNTTIRIAQVLSDVFSPLLIPTYVYTLLMWLTPLVILPERTRFITMAVIALITAIIPTALMFTLRGLGKLSDMSLSKRNERLLPMIIMTLCYIGAAFYLHSVHAPWWVCRFFIGAAVAVVVALLITLFWKISAHTIAISGLAGMMIWLSFRHLLLPHPIWAITIAFLLCGAIGSCRLLLHRHNLGQVGAGSLLGLLSILVTQMLNF